MLTDMVSGGENEAALKYLASMGAFMENAMNAMSEVAEPSFRIMMRYDRGILCTSTQNNCSGKERISGTSEGHGFGLKNIRRVAEKYHGSLTAAVRDGDFEADVLLFLEDADNE